MSKSMPSEISPIIFFRREIDDEQGLLAFNLFRLLALPFDAGENRSHEVAEINRQPDELFRAVYVFDAFNRADADVYPLQHV